MKAVVDQIQDDLAVVLIEDQKVVLHVPMDKMPEGTQEGSWLRIGFTLDEEQTSSMYQQNKSLLEKLINRGKKRRGR